MKRFSFRRQYVCILMASTLLGACASGAGSSSSESTRTGSANSQAPQKGSGSSSRDKGGDNQTIGLDTPATDPSYRLSRGDEVAIAVFNEGEFSTSQKIDVRGVIRLPYLGEVTLANRTVREAETYLEKLFVEKKLLRDPMVSIGVREYATREVSVLGAVGGAGKFRMPREAYSIEIVDVITGMGGFKATAKSDDVQVTRMGDSGEEKVVRVDVEAIMNPRKGDRNTPRSFLIYPGDRIFVPERIW
jgi:polysaccharide export outer membrane protein